jgi:hypothetical protein
MRSRDFHMPILLAIGKKNPNFHQSRIKLNQINSIGTVGAKFLV